MENYIYIAQVVSVWGKICLAACVDSMVYRRIYVM